MIAVAGPRTEIARIRPPPPPVHLRRASLNMVGMADSSFDVVSKVDRMEADNAVHQTQKEVEQRYEWSGDTILMKASSEERVKAILDVLQSKMIKRGIGLKSLEEGEPFASGKEHRIEVTLKQGIDQANAKKLGKIIRDEGPKSIKSRVEGDELRVSSKSRDDLQQTIALLKGADVDLDLQFVNFR
jgi:uncharacterized protein YajQ (UPF0234 family)